VNSLEAQLQNKETVISNTILNEMISSLSKLCLKTCFVIFFKLFL